MLREHSFNRNDLAYLGVREDSIGMPQHWYMIGDNEVPVDATCECASLCRLCQLYGIGVRPHDSNMLASCSCP